MQFIWGLKPAQVRNRLVMITLCLGILSIITEYIVEVLLAYSTNTFWIDVFNLFSVNLEESIPTWYATILLFVAAVLLAFIALAKFKDLDHFRWHWLVLSMGFLYLSIDEGAGIHELFVDPVKQALSPEGFFAFGWQIVAIPVVIVVALFYLRFMIQLPARTRMWLIGSAGLYLGGALIIEGISASLYDVNNSSVSMSYLAIATIEELFEMLGIVAFIYTLLDMMERSGYSFALHSTPTASVTQKSHGGYNIPHLIPLLLIANVILLVWLFQTEQPPQPPEETAIEFNVPFYFSVQDQIFANNGVIIEMDGIFGIDNPSSRQMSATLLEQYKNVIVVSLPTQHTTTLIASNTLFISRDDISTLLHNIGQTNFIIFEREIVQAISQLP